MQVADIRLPARQSSYLKKIFKSIGLHSNAYSKAKAGSQSLAEISDILSSDQKIIELSRKEYPATAYTSIRQLMSISNNEYQRVFKHTWRSVSDKAETETMHRSYSERLLFLLKIYVQGILVFGSVEKTNVWMNTSHPVLGNKPEDLLDTITGCQKVLDELGRIEHGLLA